MLTEDGLVFYSKIYLDAYVHEENIQQNDFPETCFSNKEVGKEEIDKVLDSMYAFFGCLLCHLCRRNREAKDQTKYLKQAVCGR